MKSRKEIWIEDSICGCLMAGAAGDALGYPIEFMSRQEIVARYGEDGICEFDLNVNGKALVSDDTQMTLFTANGNLMGLTRGYMRGVGGQPEMYVMHAYMDWYYTQFLNERPQNYYNHTWLYHLSEMAHRRAPGMTCLEACRSFIKGKAVENNSKGCGGLMRVAPLPLLIASYSKKGHSPYNLEELAEATAFIAESTHKHPLGFLPAALMGVLIYRVSMVSPSVAKRKVLDFVDEALKVLDVIYEGKYEEEKTLLKRLTIAAIRLAQSAMSDEEAIAQLGEGWVAEEAWAIALYCSLRHLDSVEDAIVAAVNHDGDSDSTGSITGNIMGAIYGYKHIKRLNLFCPNGCELEKTLELSEIILAIARDIFTGCIIGEWVPSKTIEQKQWEERYCYHRPVGISSYKFVNK